MKERAVLAAMGVLLGFALSRMGFSSWDEIHAMLTFSDLRLVLGFATAVAILALAWPLVARATGAGWSPRRLHPGIVPGAVLFGAGWALTGGCPGVVLVQIGEGRLGALFTLAGLFLGNWIYRVAHQRWFRWSLGTCADT